MPLKVTLITALKLTADAINEYIQPLYKDGVIATQTKPPHSVSLVDGIAVGPNFDEKRPGVITAVVLRHEDVQLPLLEGQKVAYVATGARIPPNTQCIIKIENFLPVDDLRIGSDILLVNEDFTKETGSFIANKGTDVESGDLLVPSGIPWGGGEVSAARFAATPEFFPPITLRLKVTGPEIVPLEYGDSSTTKVRDCNGPLIEDICKSYSNVKLIIDPPGDFHPLTYFGNECTVDEDILVFTGGISAGIHDEVINALKYYDIRLIFRKVDIKPGMPTTLGLRHINGKPQLILCLPGNPCGCFVGGHVILKPLLQMYLARLGDVDVVKEFESFVTPVLPVETIPALIQPSNDGRVEFLRCYLEPSSCMTLSDILIENKRGSQKYTRRAYILGYQRSTTPTSLSICNALLVVPPMHGYGEQLYAIELNSSYAAHSKIKRFLDIKVNNGP